jgi:predicted ferric reductase
MSGRSISTQSRRGEKSSLYLLHQLKAEKKHLLLVSFANILSVSLIVIAFSVQIANTPTNPNNIAKIGTAGPFWASCYSNPEVSDPQNFPYYVGCIPISVMFSFLGSIVGGVSTVAGLKYAISSTIRLIRLSKLGSRHSVDHIIGVAMLVLIHILLIIVSIIAWVYLIKPSETWQTDEKGNAFQNNNEWTIDGWYVFFGGLMFAVSFPFSIALCCIEKNLLCPRVLSHSNSVDFNQGDSVENESAVDIPLLGGSKDDSNAHADANITTTAAAVTATSTSPAISTSTNNSNNNNKCCCCSLYLCWAVILLLLCFSATTILPPIWNLAASSWFLRGKSPNSWVDWKILGFRPCHLDKTCKCDPLVNCNWMAINIFTDTILYYMVLFVGVILGAVSHSYQWKWKRVPLPSLLHRCGLRSYKNGCSLLEAFAIIILVLLFIVWFCYWAFAYPRISKEESKLDCWLGPGNFSHISVGGCLNKPFSNAINVAPNSIPTGYSWLQISARASGHMASLSFALTMLPVAKCNVLLSAMGLGWEEVLHWHRGLGATSFFLMTFHMSLWWIKWSLEGVLWENIFPSNTNAWLWVSPVVNHYENFTIVMSHLSWCLLLFTVMLAWWGRRSMYHLFYLVHQMTLIVMIIGLVHAWSFWYFALPGLVMWWMDRLLRMVRETDALLVRKCQAIHVKGEQTGVTHLQVYSPSLASRFLPGQYAWVLIPGVSNTVAHPFTANCIKNGHVSFLCKDMSSTKNAEEDERDMPWTRRLYNLAAKNEEEPHAPSIVGSVTVVGFYGGVSKQSLTRAPVLLVAGGIGITPVISVFQSALNAGVQDLTLLWTVKGVGMLHLPVVSDIFQLFAMQRASADDNCIVKVIVHVTRGEVNEENLPTWATLADNVAETKDNLVCNLVQIKRGRPNLRNVFEEVVERNMAKEMDGGVLALANDIGFTFACGPSKMQDDVTSLSEQYGFYKNHTETFLF